MGPRVSARQHAWPLGHLRSCLNSRTPPERQPVGFATIPPKPISKVYSRRKMFSDMVNGLIEIGLFDLEEIERKGDKTEKNNPCNFHNRIRVR
jgi:hypothetical protein